MSRRHLILLILILINCVFETKGGHAVNKTCPAFWIKVEDRDREHVYCYKEGARASYYDAIDNCFTKNASLHSPKYFPTPVYQKSTWLGLNWNVKHAKWYWTDGSPVELDWSSWNPWLYGRVGNGGRGKHCVYLDIRTRKWVPSVCWKYKGFYCERTQCPKGWTYNPYTARCVKVFPNALTYTEAARSCDEHESIIETFRSAASYDWFKQSLVPDWSVAEHRNIWLGITDQPEPGRWVWHDGGVATWTNFRSTPPYAFERDANNSCVVAMATDSGKWVAKGCLNYAHTYRYVCGIHRCQFPFKQSVNGKCYARLPGGQNAFDSSQRCGIIGGQLLTLEEPTMWDDAKLPSQSEADFSPHVAYGLVLSSAWLGLSDMYQHAVWQWNGREGRSPPTSSWRDAGQPNSLNKDCAIVTSSGKFEAKNCKATTVSTVICQRYEPYKMFECRANVIAGMGDYTYDQYSLHPQGVGRTCHVPVYDLKTNYPAAMRFCGRLGGHVMQIKTTTFMEQLTKWKRTQIDVGAALRLSDYKKKRKKRSAILPIVRPEEGQTERKPAYARLSYFWVGMDSLGSGWKRTPQKVKWNDGSEPEAQFKTSHMVIDNSGSTEHCFVNDYSKIHDQNCFRYEKNFFCEIPLSPVVRQRKQFEWNAACQTTKQQWVTDFPQYTSDGDVNGNTRTKSDDWFFDGDSCYFTPQRGTSTSTNIGQQATQAEAKSFCSNLGATLPIADSKLPYDADAKKSTRGVQLARRGPISYPFYAWIGLEYVRQGVNKWKWMTAQNVANPLAPGSQLNDYKNNWGWAQPDNLGSELCVVLSDQDLWDNQPCHVKKATVCQLNLIETPTIEVSIVALPSPGGGGGGYSYHYQLSDALGSCPELVNVAAVFCLFMIVTL